MKLRELFVSKAMAAAFAAGLAVGGSAMADESADQLSVEPEVADVIETAQAQIPSLAPVSTVEDTSTETTFGVSIDNPHMPYAVIGGVGGLAVLLSLYGASRRMRGSWLRAAAAGTLSVALLNPQMLLEEHEKLPTEVAVVVDTSASQGLGGRDVATEQMKAAILRQLQEMQGVNVRLIESGSNGNSLDGPDGTHLFGALAEGIANIPPSQLGAVIVLSDGQVHDEPRVPGGGVPLHVLVSGEEDECDRRIILTDAPLYGVVDEDVTVSFRIIDNCSVPTASEQIDVNAFVDGEQVAARSVTAGEEFEMTFAIPHRGLNVIELQSEMLEGEITTLNNQVAVPIQGIQDNIRVLVMSGAPNAGERSLRNLLKSDPAIDLVHFTILRHPNKQDDTPVKELSLITVPTRELFEEKLEEFDLIILDRWYNQGILPWDYYDAIANFVKEGGSVLAISGPADATSRSISNTGLSQVLPIAPNGEIGLELFTPSPTQTGERHPVMRGLEGIISDNEDGRPAWGSWQRIIGADEVFGDVIMQGDAESPLLVLARKDEGRIAVLLSDSAWLWARGFDGGGPHNDLMRRVSHWLLQEPDLEEETLRMSVEGEKLIVERQTLGDETTPVTVYSPSGEVQEIVLEEVQPGLWRATIDIDEVGLYRAEQDDKRSFVSAGTANPVEFEDTRSTTEILRSVAVESGGMIVRMDDPENPGQIKVPEVRLVDADEAMAGKDWVGVRESDASVLKGIQKYSLFSGLLGLGLLMGALSVMWGREGGFSLKGNKNDQGRHRPRSRSRSAPENAGPSI